MKKMKITAAILFCSIVTILTVNCTKPPSAPAGVYTDSVFNGSYFTIGYNDSSGDTISYYSKDVLYGDQHLARIGCSILNIDTVHSVMYINVHSANNLYGVPVTDFYILCNGVDTGYFPFTSINSYSKVYSEFGQTNPDITFSDSVGSAHITYNGTDYVQATFTTTLYTSALTYNAAGFFKIYK